MRDIAKKSSSLLAWIWFPIALVAVFLLALPMAVLFALYVSGFEPQTNAWLRDHFGLTYSPALPTPFFIILFLLPFLILLLYFLKLKRKPLQVPSTFLWKKSIEDLHVNSLLQWLRRNILLLLQLLIAVSLLYAAMGFRIYGRTSAGKHYILMIDNSASMAAKDADGQTRLEWAKREALKEIDASADDDNGMVIVFNSKATTLQAYTSNKGLLRQAIGSITQTQRPTRIDEALNLANSLANPLQATEDVAMRPEDELLGKERTYVKPNPIETDVYLFSDGRFPDLSETALADLPSRQAGNVSALNNIRLHFRSAGTPGAANVNNIGIVGFNAVRLTDKQGRVDDPDILNLQVLVRVQNFRPGTAANVKLYLDVYAGGRLRDPMQTTITIPPRKLKVSEKDESEVVEDVPGEVQATFTPPPLNVNDNPILHVRLPDVNDDFPLDDEAWLGFGRPRKAKVLIVGPDNPIFKAFFDQEATRKIARVQWLSPDQLDSDDYRRPALSGDVDLVIFDRCAPKALSDMPQSNAFFIDRPPPPWEQGKKELKDPVLMVSQRHHPLLRQLTTLWDLRVANAWHFDPFNNLPESERDNYTTKPEEKGKTLLPQESKLIESSGNIPIIFTLPRGSYTDLVMAFPLLNERGDLVTDWPLEPSFPLFMRNVLYHLGGVNDKVRAESVQAGEPMKLRPEASVRALTVTAPGGKQKHLERGAHPWFFYGDTDQLGIYEVVSDDKARRQFTVNLLDSNESNIEPRRAVEIGKEKIAADQVRQQPHDIWKWLVLLGLGLFLVEWYVYNRRVHV